MPETHQAKLYGTNERFTVVDDEPLRSAKLYKAISDEIWSRKQWKDDWAVFGIPSVLEPAQALSELNSALRQIDDQFVRIDAGKDLKIGGMRGERVTVPASDIQAPEAAGLVTYHWDESWSWRQVEVGGKRTSAKFTDGHHDYARELSASFSFLVNESPLSLSYVMQRYQYRQAYPTDLSFSVFYSDFAETGYEGNSQYHKELTEAQELEVLKVFAAIGGIAVDPELLSA